MNLEISFLETAENSQSPVKYLKFYRYTYVSFFLKAFDNILRPIIINLILLLDDPLPKVQINRFTLLQALRPLLTRLTYLKLISHAVLDFDFI